MSSGEHEFTISNTVSSLLDTTEIPGPDATCVNQETWNEYPYSVNMATRVPIYKNWPNKVGQNRTDVEDYEFEPPKHDIFVYKNRVTYLGQVGQNPAPYVEVEGVHLTYGCTKCRRHEYKFTLWINARNAVRGDISRGELWRQDTRAVNWQFPRGSNAWRYQTTLPEKVQGGRSRG